MPVAQPKPSEPPNRSLSEVILPCSWNLADIFVFGHQKSRKMPDPPAAEPTRAKVASSARDKSPEVVVYFISLIESEQTCGPQSWPKKMELGSREEPKAASPAKLSEVVERLKAKAAVSTKPRLLDVAPDPRRRRPATPPAKPKGAFPSRLQEFPRRNRGVVSGCSLAREKPASHGRPAPTAGANSASRPSQR